MEKIEFIIDLPFYYLKKITLPPCEDDKYSKTWAMVFPAPVLFIFALCIYWTFKLWMLILIPVGLLITLIIDKTS